MLLFNFETNYPQIDSFALLFSMSFKVPEYLLRILAIERVAVYVLIPFATIYYWLSRLHICK